MARATLAINFLRHAAVLSLCLVGSSQAGFPGMADIDPHESNVSSTNYLSDIALIGVAGAIGWAIGHEFERRGRAVSAQAGALVGGLGMIFLLAFFKG